MDKVKLYTRDGGFVVEINILPFKIYPEAIMWGERMFIKTPGGEYREGFMWVADSINQETIKQRM